MYKVFVADPLDCNRHFFVRIVRIIDKDSLCIRVIAITQYLMTPTLDIWSQFQPKNKVLPLVNPGSHFSEFVVEWWMHWSNESENTNIFEGCDLAMKNVIHEVSCARHCA